MKFLCDKQVNNNGDRHVDRHVDTHVDRHVDRNVDRHVDNDDKTPGQSGKHCRAQARIPQS